MSKMCDFTDSSNANNSSGFDDDYFYHEIGGGLKDLEYALTTITMPAVSVLGVVGNVLSFLVVQRHGLNKSCNLLILALAVGDTMLLLGINNVALKIYMNDFGFPYSRHISWSLFVFYHVQRSVYVIGRVLSTLLPMFITLECFVAIFFPLKFSRIVSPFRTKVAVGILFTAAVPFSVYFTLLTRFVYQADSAANCTRGRIVKSPTLLSKPEDYTVMVNTYVFLTGTIPVFFVLAGCFVIAIKLRTLASRRKRLTNTTSQPKDLKKTEGRITGSAAAIRRRDDNAEFENTGKCFKLISKFADKKMCELRVKSTIPNEEVDKNMKKGQNQHRTTLTLLSVCLLYSVVYTFKTVIGFIFGADDWSSDFSGVLTCFGNLAMSINSSANFLIYVALNPKFRQTFKAILSCDKERSTNNRLPSRP